jgi:hypothetical protein
LIQLVGFQILFILQEKLSLENEDNDFEDEIKNSIKESIKDTNNYFKYKFINYFGEKESKTKKIQLIQIILMFH